MGVAERRGRERAEREQRIVTTAREIATRDGWPAVTIRRLADEIEYSQPVIYSHFANRDAIVAAVAVEGFGELAAALRQAGTSPDRRVALRRVADAYLAFAEAQPALYGAMFTMPTGLCFADGETRPELRDAFAALAAAIATSPKSDDEGATQTEAFWATLHGLAELQRSARIRPAARSERLDLVVSAFLAV